MLSANEYVTESLIQTRTLLESLFTWKRHKEQSSKSQTLWYTILINTMTTQGGTKMQVFQEVGLEYIIPTQTAKKKMRWVHIMLTFSGFTGWHIFSVHPQICWNPQ